MNKRLLVVTAFGAIGLMSVGFLRANSFTEAKAYSRNSLTTTILLKDNTDEEVRNYYSTLNDKAEGELRGQNLLKNLKPILMNNQKYYSYDDGSGKSNDIWKLYEIIDRDWERSPASEISGYNSSTMTITGYKYGDTDPYIHALYMNRNITNTMTAWSNHSKRADKTQPCLEREHIWPKSHGFDKEVSPKGGARGDPMHLWAGEGYTNGIHSNDFYGYVDTSKSYTDCATKAGVSYIGAGNYSGTSKTLGSGTVFEPQDCDKGDIARACFYMVARYNNIAGTDTAIDSNNPNLTLDNSLNLNTGESTATKAFNLGILSDLLEWNKLDPVDDFEIHRNNLLFNNYTFNRNPFIDFPQWADIIWGDAKDTGKASPNVDSLNDKSISIKYEGGDANVGDTVYLTAIADEDTKITWSIKQGSDVVSLAKNETVSGEKLSIAVLKYGRAVVTAKGTYKGSLTEVDSTLVFTEPKPISFGYGGEEPRVGETVYLTANADKGSKITWAIKQGSDVISLEKTETISGEKLGVKVLKYGTAVVTAKGLSKNQPTEADFTFTFVEPVVTYPFGLSQMQFYIAIGVIAVVIVIALVLFIRFGSKKAKKKAAKYVKKTVKSQAKKGNKKK